MTCSTSHQRRGCIERHYQSRHSGAREQRRIRQAVMAEGSLQPIAHDFAYILPTLVRVMSANRMSLSIAQVPMCVAVM